MRILLANNAIGGNTGTETWVDTVKQELTRLGHEVDTFCPAQELPQEHYDLALINHNTCLEKLMSCDIATRIFTSHGVIPELEQPIEGADHYVSVSEEVQKNLLDKGFKSIIIRNPIDMDRFKPTRVVNSRLHNVLFMSNYPGGAWKIVDRACQMMGLQFERIGRDKQTTNPEHQLNWADLVVTLGRGSLEAMACNRNVVIFDYNGGDGFIDENTFFEYRKCNNSGRTNNIQYTPDQLMQEFRKYNSQLELRSLLKENTPTAVVEMYLKLGASK